MKYFFRILQVFILLGGILYAQNEQSQQPQSPGDVFYFDAICYRADSDSLARVDIYTIVPYQTLEFTHSDNYYGATYNLTIKAFDDDKKLIKSESIDRKIYEKDYFESQGGTGKFDYNQKILELPAGKTTIEVTFYDNISKKTLRHERTISILNFHKYPFTLSGIMLVSSLEETTSNFSITPHVSDNVGDLKEGFFAFFEVYNFKNIDSVDFIYEITNSKDEKIFRSSKIRMAIQSGISQKYIRCKFPKSQEQGTFVLRIIALNKNGTDSIAQSDYLAVTERSIRQIRTFGGFVLTDINKMVRELLYVASNDDMDYINAAANDEEKQERFEKFWEKLDPTPNTDRNEAFEQYYSRIETANKKYRSYNEGWRTDMGMVFVVYGEPSNKEQSQPYADGRVYERWTYSNGKQFTFVDNSGFGDFRLWQPITVTERYKYQAP